MKFYVCTVILSKMQFGGFNLQPANYAIQFYDFFRINKVYYFNVIIIVFNDSNVRTLLLTGIPLLFIEILNLFVLIKIVENGGKYYVYII